MLFRYKLLGELIGENRDFNELEIPFQCVATDLFEGKVVVLKDGNVIDAVLASSAMPGAFVPIEKGEMRLVDGGITERVPTKELRDMGAEVIVAVDVLGDLMQKRFTNNLVDTLLRCVDIMDTRQTQSKKRSRARMVDLWLEPDLGAIDRKSVV